MEVPEPVVVEAVAATNAVIIELDRQAQVAEQLAHEAAEARWRGSFRPHGVIDTESKCASQIVICGLTGGIGRWLVVPLDSSKAPLTFVGQVLDALPEKLRNGGVPFFGRAQGFFVNYGPDRSVRFNLFGEALEILPRAYRPGEIELNIGGRNRPPRTIARVLGFA